MQTILVTGSHGFVSGYLISELLERGWRVIGVDNFAKYGEVKKPYDDHPNFHFYSYDARNSDLILKALLDNNCEHFIAGAALIGGISLFHKEAFEIIARNEELTIAAFRAAIEAHRSGDLRKITVISSSMVFENATQYPTKESHILECPPPGSTYGFQKLATEYFAKGAWEQYKLPYTIVRPFNAVGTGEYRAKSEHQIMSGNIMLAMSHVVPDIIQKCLKGQKPLHLLGSGNQTRCYTYAGDLAKGIVQTLESPKASNTDFNISIETPTTVLELAEKIWNKINPGEKFEYVSDVPFTYDVQNRVPNVDKARKLLDFEATTSLDMILDEIIDWCRDAISKGLL